MHVFVSGNLALDLAGTLKWRRNEPEELLRSTGDLDAWFVEAGILDGAAAAGHDDLRRAITLREAIYELARDHLDSHAPGPRALQVVNAAAAAPPVELSLTPTGVRRRGDASAALSVVARSLITLLISPDDLSVKECGRPTCTRIYIDRSRGARRTWCGMAECGNRVKAAAYRARKSAGPPRT